MTADSATTEEAAEAVGTAQLLISAAAQILPQVSFFA
jgi:hypothetical protein